MTLTNHQLAFMNALGDIVSEKEAFRIRPLLASDMEIARRCGASMSEIQKTARELRDTGEIVIRPGINHELYCLKTEERKMTDVESKVYERMISLMRLWNRESIQDRQLAESLKMTRGEIRRIAESLWEQGKIGIYSRYDIECYSLNEHRK